MVKPYVLRYWEQEFTQLKPMKRRGNRRYYQHHEVLLIRRIRDLLYEQGFTISGARNRLSDGHDTAGPPPTPYEVDIEADEVIDVAAMLAESQRTQEPSAANLRESSELSLAQIHEELLVIRDMLEP